MKLSIVTTLYHSSPYIEEFFVRISKAANKISNDYEIIFVNDGSPDNALQLAIELHNKDVRVKIIDLSRNFGHHKAIMTGLKYACGEYVFLIDVDLEEEPELLVDFYQILKSEKDVDVVYGIQKKRKGSWIEQFSGWVFYKIFNWLSNTPIPKNFLTVRLMRSMYVKELVSYNESQFNFSIITELVGFKKKSIFINKYSTSASTYDIKKKLSMLLNAITSSSDKPLHMVFYTGGLITLLSFFYILYIVYGVLVLDHGIEGWPSLIVSIWFLGGLLSMFIGVVGLYVSRIYIETKNRPYVHIRGAWGISHE